MFLPAAVVAACLLPQPVASAWSDVLKRENARLERELAKLELDVMERQYEAGRAMRVAGLAWDSEDALDRAREHYSARIREAARSEKLLRDAVREGRTSPEAFAKLLAGLARAKLEAEKTRRVMAELTDLERRAGRTGGVDPDQFPGLARLVRKNRELRDRKQQAEDDMNSLRNERPAVLKR
jgi:hypothetical protein